MADYIEELAKTAAKNDMGQEYTQYTFGVGIESNPSLEGVVYDNPEVEKLLKTEIDESSTVSTTPTDSQGWAIDIAQSHHFTVFIDGLLNFTTPEKSFNKFLPVKSMQLTDTSYENMSIPLAIFGDFPLLNKRRVSTIQLTCYDQDNDRLEQQLRAWGSACFPKGKYVAYMSQIAKNLEYRSYNVKGQENSGSYKKMAVIPSGNLVVSRDYSANDAKLITFTLVCVGDTQISANTPALKVPGTQQQVSNSSQSNTANNSNKLDMTQGGKVKAAAGYAGAGAAPNNPTMFVDGSFWNDAKRIGKKIFNAVKK